jgi:hypothetical protein
MAEINEKHDPAVEELNTGRVAYADAPEVERDTPRPRGVDMKRELTIEDTHGVGMKSRGTGVEMKREMTQEDKELAAAGYEHLDKTKTKAKGGKDEDLEKVDITEHQLPFAELGTALGTNIDTKDPGASDGLTANEAKARLARDGQNVLTPPKKKSALRKVCV